MKIFILSIFTLFLFAGIALAQVEEATEQNAFGSGPKYFEDILDFSSGKPELTRIDVFIQVPYTTIQFVKSKDTFVGNFQVTVSIFDENKDKLVSEKIWNQKLETPDFNTTISKNNFNLSLRSFYLAPGKYYMRTAVEDKESESEYHKESIITVRNLSSQIAVSDIMLLSKRTEEAGKNKIVPNVSGNVATQKDGLPIFFEVYTPAPEKLTLSYTVLDKKDNEIFHDTELKDLDSGRTQIFHTIKDSSFSLGYYKLTVKLMSGDQMITGVSRMFFSRWAGVPENITDLDKAIEEMMYIASTKDMDYINDAKTKDEKLKRYLAFWKKQDPTPATDDNPIFEEYYRRVAYANAHFSHYIEGWKTDRGMVFILLGPPNNVERHPFDLDSKPYEVWEYYDLNTSLIFVDQTGFGDYRLITPLTGDLYRFRR